MYIVTSKPKRISEYSGVVHIIFSLFIILIIKPLGEFQTVDAMLHLPPLAYVRINPIPSKDFPHLLIIMLQAKKSPVPFQERGFLNKLF